MTEDIEAIEKLKRRKAKLEKDALLAEIAALDRKVKFLTLQHTELKTHFRHAELLMLMGYSKPFRNRWKYYIG